jgi:hypothetical protein
LPAEASVADPRRAPPTRRSRAALYALGALGAGTVACSGSTTVYAPPYGIPAPDAGGHVAQPAYGGSMIPAVDGGTDGGTKGGDGG